jgi:hypothetical protein
MWRWDMNDDQLIQPLGKNSTTTEQLTDTQHTIHELHLLHCLNALCVAGLVAIVIQTFSYVFFSAPITDQGITLYKFSLLIGPSAFFLLLMHLYELYGLVKQGEKSIPLTLDLMYFLYIGIAFTTMVGVQWYYQLHQISSTFLTTGFNLMVVLLCLEVFVALFLSKYLITHGIAQHLPHFFAKPDSDQHQLFHPSLLQHRLPKPRQMYYFRKKPDMTLWEHDDCFVQLKR